MNVFSLITEYLSSVFIWESDKVPISNQQGIEKTEERIADKAIVVQENAFAIITILVQYLQAAFERVVFGKVLVFLKTTMLLIYSYFDCSSSAAGRLTIFLPNHYLASKSASLQQISF